MAITPQQAADVARQHGLTLQDAAGLVSLATDVQDANEIAARFASAESAFRDDVRTMFDKAKAER